MNTPHSSDNSANTSGQKRSIMGIPVMWLVIGLPLLSIVAGVSLVIVAARSGGADVVRDEVQRTSQIQTSDLSADQHAAQRGLSAILRFESGRIEVIPVNGDFDRQQPLTLLLQHPTSQVQDVEFSLQPVESGWQGQGSIDDSHAWNVELSSPQGSWRLQARLPKEQQAVRLAPALTSS